MFGLHRRCEVQEEGVKSQEFLATRSKGTVTIIKGATLIDGAGRRRSRIRSSCRRGVASEAVGSVTAQIRQVPPDAEVMDAEGCTLMPGMMDLTSTPRCSTA